MHAWAVPGVWQRAACPPWHPQRNMKSLPSNLTATRRTRAFTESSVPGALLRSHRTNPHTWGKIVVLEGRLTYRILEPVLEECELGTERPGIIEPGIRHEVEPNGKVRFYVEFYTRAAG